MSFKVKDHYYKQAKKEKFLARSIYKLKEIDEKYRVMNRGSRILDLGYYPGSWTQYCADRVGLKGEVIGIDIQPINKSLCHLKNVKLFEADIFDLRNVNELGVDELFDVVLSDMAPKTTGIKSVDQDRSLLLVETVFSLVSTFLKPRGNLVLKVFDSNDAQVFLKQQKKLFSDYHFLKPKSTRSVSKEFFVIGKGFKGNASD